MLETTPKVQAGAIYLKVNGVPDKQKNSRKRYVKVLSVNDTHVHVREFYGAFGYPWSILVEFFERDYKLVGAL